jgi:hypothetical protein
MEWWKEPFFQVGLPISLTQITLIVTLIIGFVNQNKRFDDMNRRFDELRADLKEIKDLLREHDRDITALKERTGFVKING